MYVCIYLSISVTLSAPGEGGGGVAESPFYFMYSPFFNQEISGSLAVISKCTKLVSTKSVSELTSGKARRCVPRHSPKARVLVLWLRNQTFSCPFAYMEQPVGKMACFNSLHVVSHYSGYYVIIPLRHKPL